jgi:hypothetical protein
MDVSDHEAHGFTSPLGSTVSSLDGSKHDPGGMSDGPDIGGSGM